MGDFVSIFVLICNYHILCKACITLNTKLNYWNQIPHDKHLFFQKKRKSEGCRRIYELTPIAQSTHWLAFVPSTIVLESYFESNYN